jgi:hypothetical protein
LKFKILIDFLHVFFHMEKHLRTKNKLIGKSLTFPERASIVLLVCSLIAPGDAAGFPAFDVGGVSSSHS